MEIPCPPPPRNDGPQNTSLENTPQTNEVEMERFQMTPNCREMRRLELEGAGLEDVPAPWHGPTQPRWRVCSVSLHLSADLSSSGRVLPVLSGPTSCSLCPLLTHRRFRRDFTPSYCSFPQTISSLPLHMLVLAEVSCLPSEGRGLHFSDCLAHFHPCIVLRYWWTKLMPCCKDSEARTLASLLNIYIYFHYWKKKLG